MTHNSKIRIGCALETEFHRLWHLWRESLNAEGREYWLKEMRSLVSGARYLRLLHLIGFNRKHL